MKLQYLSIGRDKLLLFYVTNIYIYIYMVLSYLHSVVLKVSSIFNLFIRTSNPSYIYIYISVLLNQIVRYIYSASQLEHYKTVTFVNYSAFR